MSSSSAPTNPLRRLIVKLSNPPFRRGIENAASPIDESDPSVIPLGSVAAGASTPAPPSQVSAPAIHADDRVELTLDDGTVLLVRRRPTVAPTTPTGPTVEQLLIAGDEKAAVEAATRNAVLHPVRQHVSDENRWVAWPVERPTHALPVRKGLR